MKSLRTWIHPAITALLAVAVVILSIQVSHPDREAAPPIAPPPYAGAASARPVAMPGDRLEHQQPVLVGTGREARTGFEKPGPILGRSTPRLIVPPAASGTRDLRLTRLYFTKSDYIETGPRSMTPRPLNLWLPRREGAYCNVIAIPGSNGNVFQPARALPDGVWCLHSGTLADGQPVPDYSSPFTSGGLASPKIISAKATIARSRVTLTLSIRNAGTGEFNEGRTVVTLQKNVGTYGQFKSRWENAVAPIAPRAATTLEREYDAAKWEPGEYFFAGHLCSDSTRNDGEAVFDDFKSNVFTVAAP